jgi:hypothetical protein
MTVRAENARAARISVYMKKRPRSEPSVINSPVQNCIRPIQITKKIVNTGVATLGKHAIAYGIV